MNNDNNNTKEDLKQVVTFLCNAYVLPPGAENEMGRKSHFSKQAQEMEKLIEKIPPEFHASTAYQCGLLYAQAGDTDYAAMILNQIAKSDHSLPEVFWLLIQLDKTNTSEYRWQMEDSLGQILSLSPWRKLLDAKFENKESLRLEMPAYDIERPDIPKIDKAKLFKIAKLFDEMGLSKQAANAYREAIYCLAPPRLPDFGEDSWMAKNTAEYWLEIAQNEALNGDKKWAFQAVLMSVVSSSKTLPAALDIVKQLDVPPDPDLKPNPDPEKFNQIALLYTDCNLHTRALEALSLAEELLQIDLSGKKGTISSEWRKLVEAYAEGRKETCFLFGYKVSENRPEQIIPKKFPYRN